MSQCKHRLFSLQCRMFWNRGWMSLIHSTLPLAFFIFTECSSASSVCLRQFEFCRCRLTI
uniref:Uncharacterized protein n=1 Tax=Physcomitrium patens TaxID=3218 RepID=A0A7I3ZTE3_PHYPA